MSDGVVATIPASTETGGEETAAEGTVLTAATDDSTNPNAAPGSTDAVEGSAAPTGDGDTGEGEQGTAPDTYADFAMPEGMPVDTAVLESATPLFKELGLSQEQAQKLVDFQAAQVQAGSQAQVDAFNQLTEDWRTQSMNDPEFGGDKFDENVSIARSAIESFGTPELKQLLEDHGVGNHPEIIRFMINVGKLTQEDNPGSGGHQSRPAPDRVALLYPDST
jgi:hypothetical protein